MRGGCICGGAGGEGCSARGRRAVDTSTGADCDSSAPRETGGALSMFAGRGGFALADWTWTGTGSDTRAAFSAGPATTAWRVPAADTETPLSGTGLAANAIGWVVSAAGCWSGSTARACGVSRSNSARTTCALAPVPGGARRALLGGGQHRIKGCAKSQRRQQQRAGADANLRPLVSLDNVRPHGSNDPDYHAFQRGPPSLVYDIRQGIPVSTVCKTTGPVLMHRCGCRPCSHSRLRGVGSGVRGPFSRLRLAQTPPHP